MLGEFIFQGDVYEIKTTLDTITSQDHQIKFQSLKEARYSFSTVLQVTHLPVKSF